VCQRPVPVLCRIAAKVVASDGKDASQHRNRLGEPVPGAGESNRKQLSGRGLADNWQLKTEMSVATQLGSTSGQQAIPLTMTAAVYRGVNDVRLETVPVPAIGPGE